MDLEDSDDYKFQGYIDLQDYTHSSINVHIQDKTTDSQDISTHDYTLTMTLLQLQLLILMLLISGELHSRTAQSSHLQQPQ